MKNKSARNSLRLNLTVWYDFILRWMNLLYFAEYKIILTYNFPPIHCASNKCIAKFFLILYRFEQQRYLVAPEFFTLFSSWKNIATWHGLILLKDCQISSGKHSLIASGDVSDWRKSLKSLKLLWLPEDDFIFVEVLIDM